MRILFVNTHQGLTPTGGMGQFAKGLKDFIQTPLMVNTQLDYCLDKKPKVGVDVSPNFYYLENPISYSDHSHFCFFKESVNYERVLNVQNALKEPLQNGVYDLIICNTLENVLSCFNLGLHKLTNLVFYTHPYEFIQGKSSNIFTSMYLDTVKTFLKHPDVIIGTQSEWNKSLLENQGATNVKVLPLFVPNDELQLLDVPQEGVLYIGRFEKAKGSNIFIDVIRKTGLPAKILTNKRSESKFKKALPNADVRSEIFGEEKIKFISSAKVSFNPSLNESFSYSTLETIPRCQTVCVKEHTWWKHFDSNVTLVRKNHMEDDLLKIYNSDCTYNNRNFIDEHRKRCDEAWTKLLLSVKSFNVKLRKNKMMDLITDTRQIDVKDVFTDTDFYLETLEQIYKLKAMRFFTRNDTREKTILLKN